MKEYNALAYDESGKLIYSQKFAAIDDHHSDLFTANWFFKLPSNTVTTYDCEIV